MPMHHEEFCGAWYIVLNIIFPALGTINMINHQLRNLDAKVKSKDRRMIGADVETLKLV